MEEQYIDEATRDDAADLAAIRTAYESGKISRAEYDYYLKPRDERK